MKNINLFTFNRSEARGAKSLSLQYENNRALPDSHPTVARRSPDGRPTVNRNVGAMLPRLAATLTLLLTLGVGQMWADDKGFYEVYMVYDKNGSESNYTYNGSNGSLDLGTITSSFKIKKMYLKVWDSWGDQAFEASQSGLGYKTQDGSSDTDYKANTRTGKSGNNYELQHTNMNLTIASSTNPSGNYTFEHWWFADGTYTSAYYLKNSSINCKFTYKILPPAVKSSSVSISATNTAAGSGTGLTSGSPIILISGMGSTLTITAQQNHTDANSALWCKFGSGSYSSTTTYNISSGTSQTNQTLALNVKYCNNSASLDGAETTTTIYYKWAAPAPAISLTSVTPSSSIVAGNDITLVGTRANSSNAISFQYTTNNGSTWTDITPKTTSGTSPKTITWTVPAAHGATQTYKFRAKLAESTPIYSSASDAVSVYGTKTIKVKNTNNWATMKLYLYSDSGEKEAWSGSTTGVTSAGGQWKTVALTSEWPYFILNDGTNQIKGDKTYKYTNFTDGNCYAISSGSGTSLTLTSSDCPTAPTSVTTTAAPSSSTNVKMTVAGSIGTNGNDNITDYGFYYGTTSSPGTKAQIGTSNKTGDISKEITGLTAGTTYYFKAYATNGQGTTYGDVKSYKLPYKVTVTKPTGCSNMTNTGTKYTNSTITVEATKADGYTFSSWSTTNGTQTSTSSTSTTNTLTFTPTSDNATITAVYTENMTNVNLAASPTGKGSFTIGGAAATSTTAGVTTTRSVTAVAGTGYRVNTSANVWSSSNANITLNNVKANPVTVTGAGSGGTSTLTATFTPITYTIQFKGNGATSGSMNNQTGVTYDAATTITANAFSRTGYTFQGWATSQSRANDGIVDRTNGAAHGNLTSTQGTTVQLWAVWQAKTYTVNLDRSGTGYGSGGSSSVTATYDADMPAMTSPTAANGYAFMGYYTAEDGGGTQYYKANGTSAKTWDIDVNPTTLYAWFKKAEITELTFDPAIVAPNTTIKVTPTIAPTPTGDTHIEWRVLYDNNNPLAPQPTLTTYGSGKQFTSMAESGIYKVEATLRTGTVDGAGTVLHTKVASFQVAGNHTVTVRYKCGDYVVAAPTSVTGYPLDWSSDITAPAVTGYTFQYWTLGDGITLKDGQSTGDAETPGTNPIKIKATYDGTLTANYVKKQMIYFNNTLGWTDVWVYFYNDASGNNYWADNYGTGANKQQGWGDYQAHKPYWEQEHGHMTRIEGTNIWYFDFKGAGYSTTRTKVAFANKDQSIDKSGASNTEAFFYNAKAVYRTDFDASTLPMFVPLNVVSHDYSSKEVKTKYYNHGYWMNYPDNTGYWLKIFSGIEGSPSVVKDIPFEFNADKTMPMDLYVDLEANYTYGFKIYKANGKWYGNNGTMTANTTNWEMTETYKDNNVDKPTKNCGLTTTAAGTYRFNLYYLDDNSNKNYQYRVGVTYPVGAGDFRIVYTDGAKWSQSTTHGGSWSHPSAIITKNSSSTAVKRDTVSFYWAYGSSPAIKSQNCLSVGTGTVNWGSASSISVSGYSSVLNKKGVYNFIFEQPKNGTSIALVGVEPYTGNYYIRTDVAGTTKWDNYKAEDHKMQYSDYAATNEGFTHYYAHWVERSKNIKFVIANDYSPCVSDTLVQDVGVNFGNMESDGTLKSDGAGEAFRDKYSANIRFMYNVNDNKLSRAYISSATDIAKKFLVMRGNNASGKGHIFNEAGQELTTAGGGKIADLDEYEMSFVDDQNFIYETKIKANPTALIKLYAKYCGKSQELKGDTTATFNTTDNHAIEILGGTYAAATKELMRIVYDFKTNRLVCAWLPSDSEISGELDINADVMIIREHQDEAQQIKFANTGDKLTEVKSVYGVMRFNRWTLANKDKSTHNPLASPKSNYERQIYFISFPFDVKLGDIFGLSAYDDLWWIEYYDGAERAEKGYFQETKSFWKFMENTPTAKLEANKGYILKLDAAMLNSSNTNIWTNNIEQVELFFPSASEVEEIEKQNASITLDPLPCTKNINPAGSKEPGQDGYVAEKDRRKRDSHWYCIGVPSYANYSEYVTDAEGNNLSWSTWGPTNEGSFPFLYTWNMTDNTLSPTASAKYGFKTMNAYMVQYAGTINWAAASAPKSIAARRNANWNSSYMFRLELQKEGQKTEQTLVNLRDDDNVSAAFDFNYDLSNEGGAIYTTTSDLVTVAGNCLPLVTDQQTTVPVGVIAKTTGEYTFAMPDGTEGLSVTLVDNFTGAHTNLALGDYTVELEAGTYEERFTIVIDPRTTTTAVETIGGEGNEAAARKVFINGLMYIQRGSNLYDAQGRKVN